MIPQISCWTIIVLFLRLHMIRPPDRTMCSCCPTASEYLATSSLLDPPSCRPSLIGSCSCLCLGRDPSWNPSSPHLTLVCPPSSFEKFAANGAIPCLFVLSFFVISTSRPCPCVGRPLFAIVATAITTTIASNSHLSFTMTTIMKCQNCVTKCNVCLIIFIFIFNISVRIPRDFKNKNK